MTAPLPKPRRLTPLPGGVYAQYIRCTGRCAKCTDGAGHGPYWYRFYRVGGKVRKEYISARRVPYVRRQCAAWRALRRQERQARQTALAEWRTTRGLLREVECGLARSR